MTDFSEKILELINEDSSLIPILLNLAAQLYRENGLQEVQFKDLVFKKGDILFSDEDYDRFKLETDFQEPKMNAAGRPKVKQLYSFGTLRKQTQSNLDKFIKKLSKEPKITDLVLLPKYDGIGLRIYFGELFLTRYDQEYGLDISYKCKNLFSKYEIPKNSILRGELITLEDHEGYATKRHYASAKVGNEDPLPDDIQFICYEYLEQDANGNLKQMTFEKMLIKIKKIFNFEHVAKKIAPNALTFEILDEFATHIPEQFKTDGVVIRPNNSEFVFEDKEKPTYQVAYKFESEQFVGRVKAITWSIKQQGFLQPTILLKDPIEIDKAVITKATGVNFNFLFHQNIIPGKKCIVTLKIVPRIEGNEDNQLSKQEYSDLIRPEICPGCGGPIEIVEDSVDRFKCQNYLDQCFKFTLVTKTKKVLEIKKLGEKGIEKLIQDSDFDFSEWMKDWIYSNQDLFLILSDDIDKKTVEEKYSEEKLRELIQHFNLNPSLILSEKK